ncbi:MAG: LysR family transcriptional regulator [Luteolibacter sp.]
MPQPLPNLHHLELFYHVARAGGITAAVRTMPYGIQQPAVSGQISQLETELGVRLFQRRPFSLTSAGRELFEFAAPFFGGLGNITEKLGSSATKHIRLAAPTTVIREHLPPVLEQVRKAQPNLELSLTEAGQNICISLLEREEIDLAITELEGSPPTGMRSEILLSLPLILLLPPGLKPPKKGIRELAETHPLIRPPQTTPVAKLFGKGLNRKNIRWPARIEISSIEVINTYVAKGFGIGLSLKIPGTKPPKGVTEFPLNGFPQLKIAALWRGKPAPLTTAILDGLRQRVKSTKSA